MRRGQQREAVLVLRLAGASAAIHCFCNRIASFNHLTRLERKMAYTAKQVANEFLTLARRDHVHLTPMQLQKLVYFAYGWYLAITGERLIDELVEAWQWGPVIPSLYHEFKVYGSDPIIVPADFVFPPLASDDPEKDALARRVISKVWEIYGRYSGVQLSSMTHAANSPWAQTYQQDVKNKDIPDEVIRAYFADLGAHDRQPVGAR
jgi:uncharacterized phage-associated protein